VPETIGPRLDLLAALADPERACAPLLESRDNTRNIRTHVEGVHGLAGHALADAYKELAETTWRQGHPKLALRLLLAELIVVRDLGDDARGMTVEYFLAQWHRLRTSSTAAEMWNRTTLLRTLDVDTAVAHARALRELAVICEVAAEYEAVPSTPKPEVQALLQQAVLHRLRGSLDAATAAVDEAEARAERFGLDRFTQGLVQLRRGILMLVLGRPETALAA
jgi:hypothetical protein